MSWRKRRKLPTTIQVHMLDDDRVEVFGRRMNMAQKILLQNTLSFKCVYNIIKNI